MTPATIDRRRPTAQRGIALIVGLVILAVLSLIGIAAFSITTQEERMAGNSRDRMLAFEAAEAALRACENAVRAGGIAAFGAPPMYGPITPTQQPITETAATKSESWWQKAANALQVPMPAGGSSQAPACIAESMTMYPNSGYTVGNPQSGANAANIAHITAHGYGLNPNTVVRLESYYSM
jgi:type IV pilus assembly protein PilX